MKISLNSFLVKSKYGTCSIKTIQTLLYIIIDKYAYRYIVIMKWHLMSKMWVYMVNFGLTGSRLLNKILRYPIQSINSYFYKTIYPSLLEWDVQSMFVYMAVVKKRQHTCRSRWLHGHRLTILSTTNIKQQQNTGNTQNLHTGNLWSDFHTIHSL